MKVSTILVALVATVVASPVQMEEQMEKRVAIPHFTLPPYPTGYMEKRDIDARAYPTAPPVPTGYYHHKREANPEEADIEERAIVFPTGYYLDKRNRRAFLPSGYSLPSLPVPTYFPKPAKREHKQKRHS